MKIENKFKETEIGMIPKDWEVKSLEQVAVFKNGKVSPERNISGKFPVYGSNGVIGFTNESNSEENTVVIGRVGAYCGSVYYSKTKSWVTDNAIIGHSKNNNSSLFLFYLLKKLELNKHRSGSSQPLLNQSILYSLKHSFPIYEEQLLIAKFFSDLEYKIELNQQMNKNLDEIGHTIFKHWFIDFEFPNDEEKQYKSSGGLMVYNEESGKELPKDWKISTIGNEFTIILGGTPRTTNKSYWENGTIAWINSGKINEFRITEPTAYITKEAVDNSATKLLPKGTTVLAITGTTLGQVSRIEIDTCANQSVIGIIESKTITSEYVYFWIKHTINEITRDQTGGAQQHINKNNVSDSKILIPSIKIIQKYKKIIKPIFDKISFNCFEINRLNQIRDYILPKLMSGQIRVSLEI